MTLFFNRGIYRATLVPKQEIPLGARSVGHYRFQPGEEDDVAVKHFVQVFWSVSGNGLLGFKEKEVILEPGKVAFYFPGDTHRVKAAANIWEYRWWTMDGPLSLSIVKSFGFETGRSYHAGPAPIASFRNLKRCLQDLTDRGEPRASAIAYDLLASISALARPARQPGEPPRLFRDEFTIRAMGILQESWRQADFGVEQLAQQMNLNRSVLSRRFKAVVGVSPSDYLQRRRIQHALTLLKETTQSVEEIALHSGWDDPNYFSRCIRKAVGMPPLVFRRS